MLGSLFLTTTVSAVVPLAAASVALLRAGRPLHLAANLDSSRRVRLVLVVTATALLAVGTAALLEAGPVLATLVAVGLGGSVLAWSVVDDGSWSVRGVTVWALGVLVAVNLLGWVGVRILGSTSATGAIAGGVAWVVLLVAVTRLWPYLRERVAERARREVPSDAPGEPRPTPVAAAVAFLAAAGFAFGATSVDDPTGDSRPRAERSGPGPSRSETPDPAEVAASRDASATPTSSPSRPRDAAAGSGRDPAQTGDQPDRSSEDVPTTSSPSPTPSQTQDSGDKTPGYMKENPNRPDSAPSPGSGNPHRP